MDQVVEMEEAAPAPRGRNRSSNGTVSNVVVLGPRDSLTGSLTVEGDVRVGTGEDRGRLRFGPFEQHNGARKNIMVRSDVKDIQLEVDREHTARFLKVTLEPEGKDRKMWRLHVEVPAGAISTHGNLPSGGSSGR